MVSLVLVAVAFWGAILAVFFLSQGTSPRDYLLGKLPPLPEDLGRWTQAIHDPESGLLRESRLILPTGGNEPSYLLEQVRLRDPVTHKIVRVLPERRVARRGLT